MPMDCLTALEYLDCVRPDSDDLDLPEMADARAHLDSCDACQEAFAKSQSFDRAVIGVVQQVDVPEQLRAVLLEASTQLESPSEMVKAIEGESMDGSAGKATTGASGSRRRSLSIAIAAACALILAAGVWLRQSQPEQFTETKLLELLPLDLSSTAEFDAGFEFRLPATWAGSRRLRVSREFRGIDLDDAAGHDAAVAIFSYSPARNAPVNGILAAIPASRVQPLPNSVSFTQADSQYIEKDGRRPVVAVWQERDTVYVCLVLGSAADLEQIQRNLSVSAA